MSLKRSRYQICMNVSIMLLLVRVQALTTQFVTTRRHSTVAYPRTTTSIAKQKFVSTGRSAQYVTRKFLATTISQDQQLLEDMLYRIRQVSHVPSDIRDSLLEFRVDGITLGQVRPKIAKLLCSFSVANASNGSNSAAFAVQWDDHSRSYLTLTPNCGTTFESRSEAIACVTNQMKDQGFVTGWRNELFPVTATFYSEPVFAMERAAVSFLGVPEYGVHIVGVVQPALVHDTPDCNSLRMWMARRSVTKSKWPGMMDHIAAGGQPIGLSLTENVAKECFEEAGIPEVVTRKGLRPAGAVTYENYVPSKDVVERVVLFCFDLYLPNDFQPKPVDGEVEQFYLYNIEQVLSMMAKDYPDPMKPNCYMVVIDFLIRHGFVSPDVPGYLDLVRELRTGCCQ